MQPILSCAFDNNLQNFFAILIKFVFGYISISIKQTSKQEVTNVMIGKWKLLVDTLQSDLRSVSSEAKRRHPNVKDAAERAILKLRSLSAANDKHINEGYFHY